jgi:hypothetical protein
VDDEVLLMMAEEEKGGAFDLMDDEHYVEYLPFEAGGDLVINIYFRRGGREINLLVSGIRGTSFRRFLVGVVFSHGL